MVLIGLTGGVGMGKTTAAQALSARGIPVLDTDDLARELVAPGQPALAEIRQRFGDIVLNPQGGLARRELGQIVFADPAARRALEAILHPRIRDAWRRQAGEWRTQGLAAACVVIPLLYETGAESEFDHVVCVACSESTQRARLQARGWSETEGQRRIAAQMPVAEKLLKADFVIWTEGERTLIPAQWDLILPQLTPP